MIGMYDLDSYRVLDLIILAWADYGNDDFYIGIIRKLDCQELTDLIGNHF